MFTLAIVSPCYNEEAVLERSAQRLSALLAQLSAQGKVSPRSFILYVDDGSTDRTWVMIERLARENPQIRGISLGANVGHQYAIMAGMMTAKDRADAVVTIDADLQDDLEALRRMVDEYEQGYDIVYGVKTQRDADPAWKRLTAAAFYRMQRSMGLKTINHHADFRLLSRRALEQLSRYDESNLYLRGLIPMLGYPSTTVADEIRPREAGESKYTMRKMLNLALDGITSMSTRPLHLIVYLGVAYLLVSFAVALYAAGRWLLGSGSVGSSELMLLSLWFIGGSILVALGLVGLYVGKAFVETKRRPRYNIVKETPEAQSLNG